MNHLGEYSTDLVANKSLAFIDDGLKSGKPFFITIAPVGPHCNIGNPLPDGSTNSTPPEPAKRHAQLFLDAKVPRTPNFNPEKPSGASWVAQLPLQSDDNVAFNDNYYVKRLQTLQAIDELLNATVAKLTAAGVLQNTHIIFSSDNGYHIGQHRAQPGKQLPYEEDTNVPFVIRGPGVQAGGTRDFVTSHTDLAPTFLHMAGVAPHPDFDGQTIPFTAAATDSQPWEHINIEHWGTAASDGGSFGTDPHPNNTYKAVRVASASYNYFYAVWCNNERELYEMKVSRSLIRSTRLTGQADAYQMNNLADTSGKVNGFAVKAVQSRLDALLLVLKTCKGKSCTSPWATLHPKGNVRNLGDALAPTFDKFYETGQPGVSFSECLPGQILSAEGALSANVYGGYKRAEDWATWA